MPKTRQNDNETFKPWRIVAIRNSDGAMRATPRTPRSCDGPRGSLSMRPLGLAGKRALQTRLARLCRSHRSSSDRRTTGVSPHHTMTCTDVGGRVTDGSGSSVAAEWPDRARTVTLQPLSGWCGCVYKPGWLWPLRMDKRVSKRAPRGGESRARRYRNIAFALRARNGLCDQCGHKASLFSWRLRARRFVGSVAQRVRRLTGPVAEAPDVDLRRTARSRHQAKPGVPSCS